MNTVTFFIKPGLAVYMYVRHQKDLEQQVPALLLPSIHLTRIQPVYHFLHQLSVPHPANVSWRPSGNITFTLPHPRTGKNPAVYNYIGAESAARIEKEIEMEMKAELYELMLKNKYAFGISFKKSLADFFAHYQLDEVMEQESVMRAFQRWRKCVREKYGRTNAR